ncbi:MAG TPA: hypothetical protein PKE16_03765 [Hyphomicrobium sp.]|nr:hypothetical protein [Hyphomicrobium sp.]
MSRSVHPSPHRERASHWVLAFAVVSAPVAWILHLLVNYSIAGQSCIGSASVEAPASSHALSAIMIVDLGALALAILGGYVALDLWKRTKNEKAGDVHQLVHIGDGRTRFLAACGILTSTLFGLAVTVDALGSIVGPPC